MRIAIVNDVKMIVEILRRAIAKIPRYEVAWVAYDGSEAVKKCAQDTPDLIMMDLVMPKMGGTEAIYAIMKNTPCAILIVTSSVGDNMAKVFEAMGHGALDVVSAPFMDEVNYPQGVDEILRKIDTIAKLLGKVGIGQDKQLQIASPKLLRNKKPLPPLLVIGASTGGPIALAKIVSRFPQDVKFATVIIQHVDEQFAGGLANWLSEQTKLNVKVAFNGCVPEAGKILVAGKNSHLIMTSNLSLKYSIEPLEATSCPSVDVFFNSVAENWPEKSMAILLTGMGNDGAKGLKVLHDAGWYTVAEDKKTCVVYGMPKAAIELGAVTDVLPLDQIASKILTKIN